MAHTIRLGYRRRPDGSAEPVCEPPVDAILLHLWGRACMAVVQGEEFVAIGTVREGVRFEGRMKPNEMMTELGQIAFQTIVAMAALIDGLKSGYPFDRVVDEVVMTAGPSLLLACVDQPFIETEPPYFEGEKTMQVERPRIELEGTRVRVFVTGFPAEAPLRQWGDRLILARTRRLIFQRLANAGPIDA